MDFSNITLLIIAGGQSSRMKQDKRFIDIGGIGLLEILLNKASKQHFAEIFLCVEDFVPRVKALAEKYGVRLLVDKVPKAGPMGALKEGLENSATDWNLAVSCDMPFFEFEAVKPLLNDLNNNKVVMFERQPLAAFYQKSMGKLFGQALVDGQRKLQIIINQAPHKVISCSELSIPNYRFFNVNTPADLRLARGRMANLSRQVPVISIIAPSSGTGKTTFIEKLIPRLTELGPRVGVVKSDAHGFNLDVEGKDSFRFQSAGAKGVAVVSPSGWFITQQTDNREDFGSIAGKFDGMDLILTESRSHDTLPTISLYRSLGAPLVNDNVVALFTNKNVGSVEDVLQCDLDDIDRAVELCIFLTR